MLFSLETNVSETNFQFCNWLCPNSKNGLLSDGHITGPFLRPDLLREDARLGVSQEDHQPMICHHTVPETSDLQNRLLQMVQNKLIYFPTRTTQMCLIPICHLRRDAAELDVSFLLIWSLKKLFFLEDGDKASSHDSMTVQFSCHDDNSEHACTQHLL